MVAMINKVHYILEKRSKVDFKHSHHKTKIVWNNAAINLFDSTILQHMYVCINITIYMKNLHNLICPLKKNNDNTPDLFFPGLALIHSLLLNQSSSSHQTCWDHSYLLSVFCILHIMLSFLYVVFQRVRVIYVQYIMKNSMLY
jgi:hypothetical protein